METAAKDEGRVIEMPTESFTRKDERALPAIQTATPMSMLAVAIQKGMDPATLRDLMALQREWEAAEALKAYNVAFANFKNEVIRVFKNKEVTDGPLRGKSYAELFSVVNAVTPALSKHGLSASWKLTKDDKDWLEVTCTIKHAMGHSESVSMGGPPDTGGAKSPIQARASSVSFLERYTLKAICGVAEQGEDTDGAPPKAEDKKPECLPPYAADAFTKNLPVWTKLIKSGKKTASQIITMVSSKAVLSDEQKKQIEAASLTFAEIAEKLEAADKAKDKKALVAAATLIERIADDQQRADLEKLYESFGGEWE